MVDPSHCDGGRLHHIQTTVTPVIGVTISCNTTNLETSSILLGHNDHHCQLLSTLT